MKLSTLDSVLEELKAGLIEARSKKEPLSREERISKEVERTAAQLAGRSTRRELTKARDEEDQELVRSLERTSFKKSRGGPQVPGKGAVRKAARGGVDKAAQQAVVAFTNSIYTDLMPVIRKFVDDSRASATAEQTVLGQGMSGAGPWTAARIVDRSGLKRPEVIAVLNALAARGVVSKEGASWDKVPGAKAETHGAREQIVVTPEFGALISRDIQKATRFLSDVREFAAARQLTPSEETAVRRAFLGQASERERKIADKAMSYGRIDPLAFHLAAAILGKLRADVVKTPPFVTTEELIRRLMLASDYARVGAGLRLSARSLERIRRQRPSDSAA